MGFNQQHIGGELAVACGCKFLEDRDGFPVMLIIGVKERQIGRAIDKDAPFAKRKWGKGYRLTGAIGASKVLVLFA
jgi:hypothetical protein